MYHSYASVLESYLINDIPAMESAADVVRLIQQGIQAAFKKIKEFFQRLKRKVLDKVRRSKYQSSPATKVDEISEELTNQAITLLQKTVDDIKVPTKIIRDGAQKIMFGGYEPEWIRAELEKLGTDSDDAVSKMIDRIDQTIDIFNKKYKGHVDNTKLYDGILNWISTCISDLETADRRICDVVRTIERLPTAPNDIKMIGSRMSYIIANYGAALTKLDNLINALI